MAYQSQPPYTSPALVNVRPVDCLERRRRGGSRPGLVRDLPFTVVNHTGPGLFSSVLDVENYNSYTMMEDDFELGTLASSWISLGVTGVTTPSVANGIAYTNSGSVGMARTPTDLVSAGHYYVWGTVVHNVGTANATYRLYANMDSTTPDGDGAGVYVQLAFVGATATLTLVKIVAGTPTVLDTASGVIDLPIASPILAIAITNSTTTAYASFQSLSVTSAAIPAATGNGVGFYVSQTSGYPCGFDWVACGYQSSAVRARRKILLHYSDTTNGQVGYEGVPGGIRDTISTGAALAKRRFPVLQTTQFDNYLYIGDYDFADITSGADGIITGATGTTATFDDAAGKNWVTLGVTAYDHALLITGIEGTELCTITTVAAANLTVQTHLTNTTGCTFSIVRPPKLIYRYPTVAPTTLAMANWMSSFTGCHYDSYAGITPIGCPLLCRFMGRMVLAGGYQGQHIWYMSRVGVPADFNYGAPVQDTGRAIASTSSSELGVIGDPITALVSYREQRLLICTRDRIYVIIGDPAAGGSMDLLSPSTGMISANAWTISDTGQIYFLSRSGVFVMPEGPYGPPVALTNKPLPLELMNVDPEQNFVTLQWDKVDNGMWLFITPKHASKTYGTHFWFDAETQGWFPIKFNDPAIQPTCAFDSTSEFQTESGIIFGSIDGIIRRFNRHYSVDCNENSHNNIVVDSYVDYGPIRLGGEGEDGLLSTLVATLAGNACDVDWALRMGASAEDAYSSSVVESGTWTSTKQYRAGRNPVNLIRRSGHSAFLRVSGGNNDSWAIEEIEFARMRGGPIKLR